MPYDRFAILLAAVIAAACSGTVAHPQPDGGGAMDASMPDEGVARLDAGMDASAGIDAGLDAGTDAGWGTCTSGGGMGTCMSVSTCTGGTPVSGLCPGPADIQCCVPDVDGGPGAHTPSEILAALGACTRIGGDYGNDAGDTGVIPVCQTGSVIWWTSDMDIDCDGGLGSICMSDPYYMSDTSAHDSSGSPLDASTLPFIVIPLASTRFRYADHGIALGQVALVMYGGRMAYGIFGDAGPSSAIGEASFAMAEALGIPSSPISGGVDSGVTYLVFTGAAARVTRNEDHAEAVSLGTSELDALVGP